MSKISDYGYVYMITNNLNNKSYIGAKFGNGTPIEKYQGMSESLNIDIKEYGIENFTKIILEENVPTCDGILNEMERLYISIKQTHVSNGGYNKTTSGGTILPASDELRKLLSGENHPMFGKNHTESTKMKISNSMIGELNHFIGKHHTFKSKRMISDANFGRVGRKRTKEENDKFIGENNPMFGKKHTSETKKLFSVMNVGENNPLYGTKNSEETKLKRAESKSRQTYIMIDPIGNIHKIFNKRVFMKFGLSELFVLNNLNKKITVDVLPKGLIDIIIS